MLAGDPEIYVKGKYQFHILQTGMDLVKETGLTDLTP